MLTTTRSCAAVDMPIPPIIELQEAAKKLIWAAKKKGTLKKLTPRLIRQTIEKQLGLEEASLDASEYKSAIKSATKSALDEDPASEEEEEEILKPPTKKVNKKRKSDIGHEEDQPTPKSKGKSVTTSKDKEDEGSARKKRKTVKAKKVESEHEKEENSDSEEASPAMTKKKRTRRMDGKQFKSLEHVPTSDVEQDEPGTINRKRKSDIGDQPTPKSKGKSTATTSKDKEDEGSAKKKRKTVRAKKVESEHEKEEDSDNEGASPMTTKKKKTRRMDGKQFKSLEHVPTSDMEQDEPGTINLTGPSTTNLIADGPKEEEESPLQNKAFASKPSKETQNSESKLTDSQQSELPMVVGGDLTSELSELDDPKPKKKGKAAYKEPKTTKTKGKDKEKKSVKSSATLTKDEETIKRLKSLVLACGVRKAWSKIFQDLDSPNQHIKKLKEILADLGMTGRMSMDQAKTIKRKRELAQELEDVQQFEKTVLGRSSRSRSQTTAKVDDSENDKGTGSEDEDEDEPKRRPMNARKSIMAFLQDQSDEE